MPSDTKVTEELKPAPAPASPGGLPRDPRLAEMTAIALKSDVELHYSQRNKMMANMRQRRFQELAPLIPEAYKQTAREVRLPLLSDTIDLMTAICDDAPFSIHVDPFDESQKAYRNSSLREKWSKAIIEQAQMELGRPTTSLVRANQVADGVGVLKVLYTPDSWRMIPTSRGAFGRRPDELDAAELGELSERQEIAKKGARLPFTITDVDPTTWHPIFESDGSVGAVIEIVERPIRSILAKYSSKVKYDKQLGAIVPNQLGEPFPYDGFDTGYDTRPHVKCWEYWDREQYLIFVEDVLVKRGRHGMGSPPYFHAFAKPIPDRNPERYSRPSSFKQIWILDLLDSFWTMMSNAGYLYSYPTPVTVTPLGIEVPLGDDGRPITAEYEVGKHITLWQGQEFKFVTPPSEHLQLMGDLIQQAMRMFEVSSGLGPAIRGIGGGDQAGYAINQLIQASMMTLHPALLQFDSMLARAIAYIWRMVEKRINDDVWVWGESPVKDDSGKKKWLMLAPSDVNGYYKVAVETKPLVDQMRIARGSFAAQMVKAKLLDRRRAIEEYMGYEDPDQIIDAIWVDEAMESGPLHDKAVEKAIAKAGLAPPAPPPPPPLPGMDPNAPVPPPGGGPMNGGEGATLGGPPGLGPGNGMPLQQPIPPQPQPTEGQLGAAGPGGRPAGAPHQPMTPPIQAISPR